ncbi:glycosyltransferase family 2 protein [Flavisolibacter sp. BT320]|nr:glycosyltransferase family 2 protein [Flavisolibacter longurius]
MRIAVLLTTFNRKEKTLTCLESLYAQQLPAGLTFEVFLTDDNSKDGTAEAVQESFPDVHIFHGNGSLFWAGGMRNSWRHALQHQFDYYLLLNDDTVLHENAIHVLLESNRKQTSVCVGTTLDKNSGTLSYGGRKVYSSLQLKSYKVHSDTEYVECDLGNANIMLVPNAVVDKIGILSDVFTHGIADYDFTLKAKKNGFQVLVAPGILGYCVDDHGNNWKSTKVSLKERIQYLKSPKGLAYKEYLHYIKSHFPLHYPSAFCKLWMKTFFPFLWDSFKKSNS